MFRIWWLYPLQKEKDLSTKICITLNCIWGSGPSSGIMKYLFININLKSTMARVDSTFRNHNIWLVIILFLISYTFGLAYLAPLFSFLFSPLNCCHLLRLCRLQTNYWRKEKKLNFKFLCFIWLLSSEELSPWTIRETLASPKKAFKYYSLFFS